MDDLISRQAAIDIERNATVDTNPSHFEAHQKFTQFMDDAEISSFGRWQWSNGFNTALTAVGIDLKKLPSAQPESRREWYMKGYREAQDAALHESCTDCPLYDHDRHRCPRFNKVIPNTLQEILDTQPRMRGKWKTGINENGVTTSLFCSECNYENKHWYEWNYCPNCGADMREEEQDA